MRDTGRPAGTGIEPPSDMQLSVFNLLDKAGEGRSHVEVEKTTWEDCEAGANVLLHAMLRSANEVS